MDAAGHLAHDERLLEQGGELLRFWESAVPVVVVGRSARIPEQVRIAACEADGVRVLRRCSGGGAVVLGPGCLNFSMVFSLAARPRWRDVHRSVREILAPIARALSAEVAGESDLTWRGRKVSGNAQRRTSGMLLHHGTLLYDFDSSLSARYLLNPLRQPAYRLGREDADFLGNLPFSAQEIRKKVAAAFEADLYLEDD